MLAGAVASGGICDIEWRCAVLPAEIRAKHVDQHLSVPLLLPLHCCRPHPPQHAAASGYIPARPLPPARPPHAPREGTRPLPPQQQSAASRWPRSNSSSSKGGSGTGSNGPRPTRAAGATTGAAVATTAAATTAAPVVPAIAVDGSAEMARLRRSTPFLCSMNFKNDLPEVKLRGAHRLPRLLPPRLLGRAASLVLVLCSCSPACAPWASRQYQCISLW
jgi:hypothetical protein